MKKEVNITVGIIAAVGIAFSAVSLNTSSKNTQQVSSNSEKNQIFQRIHQNLSLQRITRN
ncbi:hypothetical protein ARA02_06405 [Leuconostoc mesenteroides subsp. jonggajibkimchii]|uniref:hypothetical protein n=1 Tax=Leuconostoc mesenteroides TaxID=1245 RepID=UPI000903283B|nr:hypothetical protein [Leuconostoc mesenteroides]APE76974.1 hypothetical protein ARA02_06405 [Leuconostoc mesenteroides subsp. jonggajibkimchii]